jgi:hypothetical protein
VCERSSVNTHFAYHSAAFPFHMSGAGFIFAFAPAAGIRVCSVARTLLHPPLGNIFAARTVAKKNEFVLFHSQMKRCDVCVSAGAH